MWAFYFCNISLEAAKHIRGIMEIMSSTSEENNTCTSLISSAGIFAHSEGGKLEFTCLFKSTMFLKNFASDNFWQLVWKCTCVRLQECFLILAGRGFKTLQRGKKTTWFQETLFEQLLKRKKWDLIIALNHGSDSRHRVPELECWCLSNEQIRLVNHSLHIQQTQCLNVIANRTSNINS